KLMSAGTGYQAATLKEKPQIKVADQKYKGFEFTSVKMVWALEKMVDRAVTAGNLPEAAKKELTESLKTWMGEGMNYWVGTDGKVYLQVIAKDWKEAQKQIDRYLSGTETTGTFEHFAEVRKEMPAEATLLAVIDMPAYARFIIDGLKPLM